MVYPALSMTIASSLCGNSLSFSFFFKSELKCYDLYGIFRSSLVRNWWTRKAGNPRRTHGLTYSVLWTNNEMRHLLPCIHWGKKAFLNVHYAKQAIPLFAMPRGSCWHRILKQGKQDHRSLSWYQLLHGIPTSLQQPMYKMYTLIQSGPMYICNEDHTSLAWSLTFLVVFCHFYVQWCCQRSLLQPFYL